MGKVNNNSVTSSQKVDYLGLVLNGMSKEDAMLATNKNVKVAWENDPKKSYEKHLKKGNIPSDTTFEQFLPIHEKGQKAFLAEKKIDFDRDAYHAWQRPLINLSGINDPNSFRSKPLRELREHTPSDARFVKDSRGQAVQVRTDQEIYDKYGVYVDASGKIKSLDVYTTRAQGGIPTRRDENGKKWMLVEDFVPEMNRLMWKEVGVDEQIKGSMIRSMHGPQAMRQGWMDAFGDEFINAFVDMTATTPGSFC